MLECCDIINQIDELLYEVIDSKNNILYPKTNEEIEQFENIVANYETDSIIYDQENNKWYKYYIKTINKGNELYQVKYLLDISQFKEAEEKYKIDSLTKVLARSTILEKMSQQLLECYQNNMPFSIIMGDIDFFKKINDTYGHIAGDKVLKNIGIILLENTQADTELVGRYGGEEFLFFLKNVDLNQTMNKITNIKKALDNLIINYKDKYISNITMSFGIYHINNLKKERLSGNTKEEVTTEIISGADMALYKSKDGGRNQTHVYSDAGFIEKIEYK